MFCYRKVKHRLRPPRSVTISTTYTPSPKHRPVKLSLVKEGKGQSTPPKAHTTTKEFAPLLHSRQSTLRVNTDSAVKSQYQRLVSHDAQRRSSTPSHPHTLTLSYDRSRMKRPSIPSVTPTPDISTQRDLSEPYLPRITVARSNWSAWLARNYYHLNSCKFFLTFLINVILLTFKVPRPL